MESQEFILYRLSLRGVGDENASSRDITAIPTRKITLSLPQLFIQSQYIFD
jgi:hypothetical protein